LAKNPTARKIAIRGAKATAVIVAAGIGIDATDMIDFSDSGVGDSSSFFDSGIGSGTDSFDNSTGDIPAPSNDAVANTAGLNSISTTIAQQQALMNSAATFVPMNACTSMYIG
jgi:hypothetical protein